MKRWVLLSLLAVFAVAGLSRTTAGAENEPAGTLNPAAWGDVDCSGGIEAIDALKLLDVSGGLTVIQSVPGCPEMGSDYTVGAYTWKWGDLDCSGTINVVDALKALDVVAGLRVAQTVAGCPALGPGGALDGDVVASIGGEHLVVTHSSGAEMLTASSQWADYFAAIGAQSDSVLTSTAEAEHDSTLDFQMTAIRAAGVGWSAMLDRFAAAIQAHPVGTLTATQQTFGNKNVWKVTTEGVPAETSYYYSNGSILYLVSTHDSSLAEEALNALPASSSFAKRNMPVPQADDPEPGASPLTVTPVHPITPPVCVGEDFGRQHLELLALDSAFGMPVTASFTGDGQVGVTDPPVSLGATGVLFYKATSFTSDHEDLQLKAQAPAGGIGVYDYSFPVQHCLNGTWQDGPRVLKIGHELEQITANIQSGKLCDEEGGVAFSGTLAPPSAAFTGSDLKVCNPDDCVTAGVEPVSTTVDYTADIALDGRSIDFTWKSEDSGRTYDDQGHLTGCPPTGATTEHTFSIDRISFGPDLPY